nr:MptD family putative ECF transporter S component [uncultured Eisenbergiella sp.]
MKQNKTYSNTKLKGQDFINLGIFTVIFIVLFLACIMVMSLTIYTQPFGVALGALIAGPVYMLLRSKTPKAGAILLFGILFGLVMFVMGSGWPIIVSVAAGALLAELIARSGNYRNYIKETVSYAVLMTATAAGSYVPLLTMKDYYRQLAETNSIDNDFMAQLVEFVSGPYLILAAVVTIAAAVLGTLLARAMFRKHFIKAGLVREAV